MKKLLLLVFVVCVANLFSVAQNYDTVSGATQKEDAKNMNLDNFKKALQQEKKSLVFSTVNEDGTPNAAVYGTFINIEENVFAVNSMADSKTTKINLIRDKRAILLLNLDGKNEDGFDGAKVVLEYVDNPEEISKFREKMENSTERTTFFRVKQFLVYH